MPQMTQTLAFLDPLSSHGLRFALDGHLFDSGLSLEGIPYQTLTKCDGHQILRKCINSHKGAEPSIWPEPTQVTKRFSAT